MQAFPEALSAVTGPFCNVPFVKPGKNGVLLAMDSFDSFDKTPFGRLRTGRTGALRINNTD